MSKYIVKITRNEDFAKQYLKGAFLWLYLFNQKQLYNIIVRGKDIKQYRYMLTDKEAIFIQEGEAEHLEEEKKKLDKFFYGELDTIKKDNDYKNIVNNGRLNNVINRLRKIIDYPGKTVLAFFNNMGIFIIWKIE